MGFEHWEVGFRKKMGWEMGLVPPFRTLTKHRGCKEAAAKYYNYTANKAEEEREHRLSMLQQDAVNRIRNETDEESSRGKFTVKIIGSSM